MDVNQLVAIFCEIDDFCNELDKHGQSIICCQVLNVNYDCRSATITTAGFGAH